MTRAKKFLRAGPTVPRRTQLLRMSVATALWCAVYLVVGTASVRAGINVWTSQGPPGSGQVNALAIDPATPKTLYAGALEVLFKSTDGADTWNAVGTGLPDAVILALLIDPTMPSTLDAGMFGGCSDPGCTDKRSGGVFKSTDGGATWAATGLSHPAVRALAIDPTAPSTLYTGTFEYSGIAGGAFKSTDGGDTWSAISTGLPAGALGIWINALAIDPTMPSTLYAGTYSGGVFKSTDGGSTWGSTPLSSNVNALAIGASTPNPLYAGTDGDGLFKSTDGGTTWTNTRLTAAYVYAVAIDPITPSTVYAGSENGVFKSRDGGGTWSLLGTGFSVRTLVIDPIQPSRLYAGAAGGGVFAIEQVEPSPTPTATPTATSQPGDGGGCAVMPGPTGEGHLFPWPLVPFLAWLRARRRGLMSTSLRSARQTRSALVRANGLGHTSAR